MTYIELIEALKAECALEPNIGFVGSKDIEELNKMPNIAYNVCYITPNTFNVSSDTISYSINLFYISRWDETAENQLLIQSNGILALTNIINRFAAKYSDIEVQYPINCNVFYQKFKDMTAGVYFTINLVTDNTLGVCYE